MKCCDRPNVVNEGTDKKGLQRFRCSNCNKTWSK